MSLVSAENLTALNNKGCSYKSVVYGKFTFLLMHKNKGTGLDWASTISVSGTEKTQPQKRILLILFAGTAVAKLGQDLGLAEWEARAASVCL